MMNSAPSPLKEIQEVDERHGRFLELRAEGPSERHILHQSVAHGAHRAPPVAGHGRATSRNASKDTWA